MRKLETPYPNKKTAKPIAMTQVVSVRTMVQKQPRPRSIAGAAGGLWNSNVLPVYVDGLTATP